MTRTRRLVECILQGKRGTGPGPTRYCVEQVDDSELAQEAEMLFSFKRLAAAVVLGICAVSTSGVMAQQTASLKAIRFNGDITSILAELPHAYGVTMGLELDTQRYHRVEISVLDATVTDAMNAIVQSSKKYQWRQTGEFIDVWPVAGGNQLLDTKISSFNVKNLSPAEAFDQLFNLPEVQANMTAFNLKRRAPEDAPGKLTSSRFSITLEGVSLREALDRIAQESHLEIWIFRNYPNGFFSISSR